MYIAIRYKCIRCCSSGLLYSEANRCKFRRGGGDLVVQGDVPVAKFRVSNSAINYLLGSKNFKFTTAQGCEN